MSDNRRIWIARALPPRGSNWAWRAAVTARREDVRDHLIKHEADRGIYLLELMLMEAS